MNVLFYASITIVLYALAVLMQVQSILRQHIRVSRAIYIISFMAICLHAWLLYQWVDLPQGQNLSYLNIASTTLWLAALLTIFSNLRFPVLNLILFIFPLAIISIVMITLFPHYFIVNTSARPKQLIHILLSVLAFSFLCLGTFQALFLAIQEYCLRHKKTRIIQILPPLQTMGSFLFQTILIGFVLLTCVLITGIIFFHSHVTPYLIQKILLSSISWLIFAVLLFGRYVLHWHGKFAIRGTTIGFIILAIAYFCSRIFIRILF